jgi:hypothetical protein
MLSYAVHADPSLALPLDRARALVDRGRAAETLDTLLGLSRVAPEVGEVWEVLTLAALQTGDLETARHGSQMLLRVAPGPTAYLLRSQALLDIDPEAALAQANNARAAAPEVWVSHLATRRPVHGEDDLRAARTALALSGSACARALLADVLLGRGHLDEAERQARVALRLDCSDPTARAVLADVTRERRRRATRSELRRSARAQVSRTVSRLLTLVVGTELFAVLGAAVLVGVTARDGWSGPLVALFAAGLMAVGLVSRRGRRLLGRRWWLSLAGRGAAGGVAMVAFLGFTACLGIALSLTCLTPSAELRSDTLMLSVVAVLGSSVAALSASLARH